MTHTQNLGLTKFESTEKYRISQSQNSMNENMELIDEAVGELTEKSTDAETRMTAMQDAIAIVANGNTHAPIASGQFVYVKGHGSLAEGLYKATAAIAANGALSTSNLTADGSGGLNALKASVDTLNSNIVNYNFGTKTLAQFQSELVTYAGSMGYRTYKHISVEISAQSGLFLATTYVGTLEKLSSDTRFLVTLRNAYEAAPGDIEMTYKDGTWTISSLGSKITWKVHNTYTIGSNGQVSITLPSGANEYAIRIGNTAELLVISADILTMSSGWINIGQYAGRTVTGQHAKTNEISPIAFRNSDDSYAYAGETLYVLYR